MTKSLFLLIIMALFGTSSGAPNGDNSDFFLKVQKSVEQKESSNWKVVKSRIPKNGNVCFFELTSGTSEVGVLIFLRSSQEEAAATLSEFPNFLGLITSGAKLSGVGDENYVWQSSYNRNVGVDFRRGKVAVHVASGSIHIARVFAQHIAAAIDAAEQALGADSP